MGPDPAITTNLSTPDDSTAHVSFARDTPALANAYARSSAPQFGHGRLLLDSLSLQSGESVLDLGAGTGELARLAAGQVGESGSVLAFEPLPDRVSLARSQPLANLRLEVGGSGDLDRLPASSFDVVLLNSVFHWIADQQRLLHDLGRLLKPGGRLGLSTGIAERPHQQVAILAPLLAEACGGGAGWLSPPHVARRDVLHHQLEAAGYVDVAIEEHTFVDHFADFTAVLEWNESSFFGHFLEGSSPSQNPELWAEMERTLESLRQPAGIELERYLFLVRATKL